MERFLYRISVHPLADHFVLKGALLLTAWQTTQSRPTVDIDLSARTSNDHVHIRAWIEELCALRFDDDGIEFDGDHIEIVRIREGADYEGVRVRFEATLARAKVPMQVDLGFGDVITPPASRTSYPVILELPRPLLLAYPKETVIAEKLEAMTELGLLNSRLKDYFDIWLLASLYEFDSAILEDAIHATFTNRRTNIEKYPVGLTAEFSESPVRQSQWLSFRKRGRFPHAPEDLPALVSAVAHFATPILESMGEVKRPKRVWKPGALWRMKEDFL